MKRASLIAVCLFALFPLAAQAQILVAVEDGSPNGSGAGIVAQLNDDTWADFTATLVSASDIDALAELANYDVVVLGGSGSENADWTADMANAISQFVAAGGGAILTGWGNYEMQASSPVFDVLDDLFPGQNIASTDEYDDSGATLVITQVHPIVDGLSDFAIAVGCCTELNSLALESGDLELATMNGDTVVAVKDVGAGVSVYLGPVYMANESTYASMFPALRVGNPDRLLEQAVAWAAGGVVGPITARATFEVTKDFTDDNPGEIEVTISCNTGLPLEQSKDISEGAGVEFVVTEFDAGELDCEITEDGATGYDAEYFDGLTTNSTGCEYEDLQGGLELECSITNTPAPVDVVIHKEWVIEGSSDADGVSQEFNITLTCESEIIGGYQVNGDWRAHADGEGDATFTFEVIPEFPSTTCEVDESVFDSAVEVDNGCGVFEVSVNNGHECTITNTVFFEGIPTLNQYGLALLALLMLGVGFVGFRRLD